MPTPGIPGDIVRAPIRTVKAPNLGSHRSVSDQATATKPCI